MTYFLNVPAVQAFLESQQILARHFQPQPKIDLEILSRLPSATQSGRPRLLFVHGINVGAWIWDEHFLRFFADAGFESYAVSLRGHGESGGHDGISNWRLADYTADLDQAVRQLGEGPLVVIGHSLGGAVVQNWLRTCGKPLAAALLGSVPPWGLAHAAWQMWHQHPELFREVARMSLFGTKAADAKVLRDYLFSDDMSDAAITRFANRVQEESRRVAMELQGWMPVAPLPWRAPPMFVLGGMQDRLVPHGEVARTARYYGSQATLIDQLAHVMMLEPRWEQAANALLSWLIGLGAKRGRQNVDELEIAR